MKDHKAIIKQVAGEHQIILSDMKLAGETINDREAIITLEQTRSNWIPGQVDVIARKRDEVLEILGKLVQGLERHYVFEEDVMPPLLGKLLMKTIRLEHRELKTQFSRVIKAITGIKLEGIGREELLAREWQMRDMIEDIRRHKEEHLAREEAILNLLHKAFQEEITRYRPV